jgi:oligosaccharide repeat unit polymerase
MAFQMDVKEYFGIGFLQIFLHLVFYNLGYFIFINRRKKSSDNTNSNNRKVFGKVIEKKLIIFFLFTYMAVFINTLSVGINLVDVFLGKFGDPTMGLRGGSYYIQNLADSLIGFIVIAFYFQIKPRYLILMLILSMPLFLILGFRYRIILSFFGIILIYFYDNQFSFKSLIKYFIIFSIAFYSLLLLTQNRTAIYMQKYDDITYDISDFDFDIVFSQSRASMIDFAVYQHLGNNKASIDYGETMIGYIFIKMMPASLFAGGVKPYPPPQFPIIDEAINGTRDNGEAVTSLGGAFVAFYYPGIYIMAFILGFTIAKLQNRFEKSYLSMVGSLIANLAIFQWITRGYFPQEIDHLAYMLFPILLLVIFVDKKKMVIASRIRLHQV